MNPVVQHLIRQKVWQDPNGKSLMQRAYRQAYVILRCATPKASKYQEPVLDLDQRLEILRLDRHIKHLGVIAAKCDFGPDHDLASLLYDAGSLIWRRQIDLEGVIKVLNQALKFLPRPGDVQDNLLRSHIYLTAGRTYHSMGPEFLIKSANLSNLAWTLRKKLYENLGPYDRSLSHKIWLSCARIDVATAQLQGGAIETAHSHLEDCLKDYATWCDEQEMPFDTAKMYCGLANCYLARSDLASAVQYARRARATAEGCPTSYLTYHYLLPKPGFL